MFVRHFFLTAFFSLLTLTGAIAQLQRHPLTRTAGTGGERDIRSGRTTSTPLRLPFFDDFSTYSGRPDDLLWVNGGVLINNQFALNPPSRGVATFDGLRANGKPYNLDPAIVQSPVDTLTTRPIDLAGLTTGNNVVLSFFWQAGGLGEMPDPTDSLLLQFKNGAGNWRTVRSFGATARGVQDFRYEALALTPADFHAAFQFRFLAFGRPAGMYDIWNVDYVYLGQGRTLNQQSVRDLTVSRQPKSVLRRYTAMPWEQFNANPALETATVDSTVVNNLENNFNFFEYRYTITDLTSGRELYAFRPSVAEQISANQKKPVGVPIAGSPIPVAAGPRVLQSRFAIETPATPVIPGVDLRRNDTVSTATVLNDYYAYDDGTAEYALGIGQRQGRVAVRYVLNKPAQLTAVKLFITPLERDLVGQTFVLSVWKRLDNLRESTLYQRSIPVTYSDSLNKFITLFIQDARNATSSISVTDTFYVGWQQTSNDLLTVGLDVNTDSRNQIFYNITGIDWQANRELAGSLMIRPVFGNITTSVEPQIPASASESAYRLFPNPATGPVSWTIPGVTSVQVFDLPGKEVRAARYQPDATPTLDLSGLPDGIYVLHLHTGRKSFVRKVVLRR